MKKQITLFLTILLLSACSSKETRTEIAEKNYFPEMDGCFLLFNVKTQKFDKIIGEATCQKQLPACSTFKVPLAVMAFDSGVLKNEKQTLKWDGKKRWLPAWNQDHNAQTWMRDSVVWFSQELTPKMGMKRFKNYLKNFNYGNQNVSGGLTQAWLKSPNHSETALSISGYEQVVFMKNLWANKLPVTKQAMELTRKITFLEKSPHGYFLSGKTGSNFYDEAKTIQLGWFISHLQRENEEYIIVTNISDLKPTLSKSFGGPRAKEITKNILSDMKLW